MSMHDAEVLVIVDADGSYVAATDEDAVKEAYTQQVGELGTVAFRLVRVDLSVHVPELLVFKATAPALPDQSSAAVHVSG